jgi:hypothetical protein
MYKGWICPCDDCQGIREPDYVEPDYDEAVYQEKCHCGKPIRVYKDIGMLEFTRGLCEYCDSVRCDAYPGACRDDFNGEAYPGDDYTYDPINDHYSWELR